jgi:hypothetical protein
VQPQLLLLVLQLGLALVQAVTLAFEHCSQRPPTQAGSATVGQARVPLAPLSPLHASHVAFDELQTGVSAGQSELLEQPQVWLATTQTGVAPLHAVELVPAHCRHWPATHAGVVALGQGSVEPDALSPLQAWQTWIVASQTGALAGHSELVEQAQIPVAVLQVGAVALQALLLVAEHCAQAPVPRHAGEEAEGHARDAAAPLSPLQVWQVLFPVSQTGAPDGQLALEVQPHVLLEVLQLGLLLEHAVVLASEHWAQRPATQAGSAEVEQGRVAAEPWSPLHAWQMPSVVLHTGAVSGHSALLEQPQVLVPRLQVGVTPTHRLLSVAEHSTQAPELRQAGAKIEGHSCGVPEPLSPLHAEQVPVAVSQTGEVPEQREDCPAEHSTQAPDPRQTGEDAEGQGSAVADPLLPVHPAHRPLDVLQMGAVPEQRLALVAEH